MRFNLVHEREWTGETVSDICKRYGTSRKTYYKWINRYKQKGIEGLLDVSKKLIISSTRRRYHQK
ncbi:MAG: helix-turn-helix domain-containing protein [Nitrososphaeraceae archaeon]